MIHTLTMIVDINHRKERVLEHMHTRGLMSGIFHKEIGMLAHIFTALCVLATPVIAQDTLQGGDNHNGKIYAKKLMPTTDSRFNTPVNIAFDNSSGRLYMCDQHDNRVLWWNNAGSLSNGKAADGVLGQVNFTSHANEASETGLHSPEGISVDASGSVWVADNSHFRVVKFNKPNMPAGTPAVLVLGQPYMGSEGWNEMGPPTGVFVDSHYNVWVSEKGKNRVIKYNKPTMAFGEKIDLILGKKDFNSDSSIEGMGTPFGVSVDAGDNIWVVGDDCVRKYNKPTAPATINENLVIGIKNTRTCHKGGMNDPEGFCLDNEGNVWVADTGNNRVLKFNKPTMAAGETADLVLGQPDFTSNMSTCTQTGMRAPLGVAVDVVGNVWVADTGNSRILKFNKPTMPTGEKADLVLGQPNFVSNNFQWREPFGYEQDYDNKY